MRGVVGIKASGGVNDPAATTSCLGAGKLAARRPDAVAGAESSG